MSAVPNYSFSTADEDILILIFSCLSIPDIISARCTCKRIEKLSRLPAVWINVYYRSILPNGLPFPQHVNIQTLTSYPSFLHIEQACIYSFRLEQFWRRNSYQQTNHVIPDNVYKSCFPASGTEDVAISDVRIFPGTYGTRIVTISKGIWSTLVLWETDSHSRRVIGRWTCQGAVFRGFVVTDDPTSKNCIAISVSRDDECFIVVLCLGPVDQSHNVLHERSILATSGVPTALKGNMLAYSDAVSETTIFDIEISRQIAVLKSNPNAIGAGFGLPGLLNNSCSQVVFIDKYVFVIRARTFELFEIPSDSQDPHDHQADSITPISWHSFGWVESISVTPRSSSANAKELPAIDIYIRTKKQDLWHPQPESIEVWTLWPEPHALLTPTTNNEEILTPTLEEAPYAFPPVYQHSLPSLYTNYTPPRCRTLCSGPRGTVIYICSNAHRSMLPMSVIDAVALDHSLAYSAKGVAPTYSTGISSSSMWSPHSTEAVLAVMLPSSAMHVTRHLEDRYAGSVWMVPLALNRTTTPWSALDYDETSGVVAVGSGDGHLVILRLGQEM